MQKETQTPTQPGRPSLQTTHVGPCMNPTHACMNQYTQIAIYIYSKPQLTSAAWSTRSRDLIPALATSQESNNKEEQKVKSCSSNILTQICTYECECASFEWTLEEGGEAQSHDRIHQGVVTRSTSLAAHPRRCRVCEATQDQQQRGLFLDKTQLVTPLSAKYFSLKNA